jgi:hypothetical protein
MGVKKPGGGATFAEHFGVSTTASRPRPQKILGLKHFFEWGHFTSRLQIYYIGKRWGRDRWGRAPDPSPAPQAPLGGDFHG